MARPFKFSEWSYINLTLGAFVFSPEIRRLIDWRGGLSALNFFSALPTLMLIPIAFFVYRRRALLKGSAFTVPAAVWTFAFAYAFVIALAYKFFLPGIYGLAVFELPVFVGAWFAVSPRTVQEDYYRLAYALFTYGAIAGAYGIIQYTTAPPWDTAWMQAIKADSFGQPERFGIRVFSLMNGPGVYAEFTACAMIIGLPIVRIKKPWTVLGTVVMAFGLLLSLVRSAWLSLIIGLIVFAIVSPLRKQSLHGLLLVPVAFIAFASIFFLFVPSAAVQQTLINRISTLGDVSEDASAQAREDTSLIALTSAVNNPLGQGLGLTGSTASLAEHSLSIASDIPTGAIDNGFISRFIEMGVLGFGLFLLAVLLALIGTWAQLRAFLRRSETVEASLVAAAFATQISIFLVSLSGDVYSGVGSVLFFAVFGLGVKRSRKRATSTVRATIGVFSPSAISPS